MKKSYFWVWISIEIEMHYKANQFEIQQLNSALNKYIVGESMKYLLNINNEYRWSWGKNGTWW